MVPVRKPGRPLSSCACPPGQSCACGGIRVAIPRKQKCKCGLDTAEGDHADHETVKPELPSPALTSSDLPVSPTRSGVFRVQKTAPSSRQTSRKQSFDPAHLARIDPDSVNIVNPYTGSNMDTGTAPNGAQGMIPHRHTAPMSGMAFVPALPAPGYQQPGVISYGAPVGYALVPIHSHVNSPALSIAHLPENGRSQAPNGNAPPPTNAAVRSCCAPAPNPAPAPVAKPPQPQQPSEPSRKSCCGRGSDVQSQTKPTFATHQRELSRGNNLDHVPPPLLAMKQQQQQDFPVPYPNSNIFTYPANLGTWNQPLNPATWAQLQQVAQPHPSEGSLTDSLQLVPNGDTAGLHTTHECSCGPGCQCVGCLAHPFNSQTLEYVGGAWDYDGDAPYGANGPGRNDVAAAAPMNGNPVPAAQANGHGINANGTNGQSLNSHNANGVQQPTAPDTGSPIQAQTPSDASGLNEELPASDFMFVNLPLFQGALGMEGDSCGGSSAFCPCGVDCECVGCLVHNARPLQAGEFEE